MSVDALCSSADALHHEIAQRISSEVYVGSYARADRIYPAVFVIVSEPARDNTAREALLKKDFVQYQREERRDLQIQGFDGVCLFAASRDIKSHPERSPVLAGILASMTDRSPKNEPTRVLKFPLQPTVVSASRR